MRCTAWFRGRSGRLDHHRGRTPALDRLGLLRTAQSVTPSLTGTDVAWSLLAYMAVYLTMYPADIAVMARIIRQGPLAPPSDASATIAHAHSTFNVPVEQQS
jgi:cytochrome bd-type quinol oxidase subunit 1